jgi:ferredoxin-NADP reductase
MLTVMQRGRRERKRRKFAPSFGGPGPAAPELAGQNGPPSRWRATARRLARYASEGGGIFASDPARMVYRKVESEGPALARTQRKALAESASSPRPGAIDVRLTCIRLLARDTNLYTFERMDGGVLPGAMPGAHISFMLPNGIERQYSLINYGGSLSEYQVGVKLDPASRGGSLFMHNSFRVGATVPIEPPRNNFPLVEDAEHVVLFAGGIGITPIYCMVRRLKELGRPFEIYYSARSRADAAFLRELEPLRETRLHFDAEKGGVMPIPTIIPTLPRNAHLYCCGPTPMLAAFEDSAAKAGFPAAQIHVEYFTPKFAAADEGGFMVELTRSKKELTVPKGKTILQVVREAGVDVPFSCEEGICGACETRVISGTPDHRDSILTESERKANATMMICCSGSKTPKLVLDL